MTTTRIVVVLLALLSFLSACRSTPTEPEFDHRYAEVDSAWKLRDFETARRKAQQILQEYPDYPHEDLKLTLAGAEDQLGNKVAAASIYKELADTTDSNTVRNHCLQLLAVTQRALGRYEQAVATYEAALLIEEEPKKKLALQFGLGLCLQRSREFDQAKVIYQDIIAAAPQSDWARYSQQHLRFPDFYTVQVGAVRQKNNAQKQARTLRSSGYDARIDEGLGTNQFKLYYVRIGQWVDRKQAERVQKSLVGSRLLKGTKNIRVVP